MQKTIILLVFLCIINCFADYPITCKNIYVKFNPQIKTMITNICNSRYFNTNIIFINSTANITYDYWINKKNFIIIDSKSNTVLLPYNTIFKQLVALPFSSSADYRNLIKFLPAKKLPSYAWIHNLTKISTLVYSDVYSINSMFNNVILQHPAINIVDDTYNKKLSIKSKSPNESLFIISSSSVNRMIYISKLYTLPSIRSYIPSGFTIEPSKDSHKLGISNYLIGASIVCAIIGVGLLVHHLCFSDDNKKNYYSRI